MKKIIFFLFPITLIVMFNFGCFSSKTQPTHPNFSKELSQIILNIDKELKALEVEKEDSRMLSGKLIQTICRLANKLEPSTLKDESTGLERLLSVERGKLLTVLINKQLNPISYQQIFRKATFENAYLENIEMKNASLDNILLNRAYLKNVNLEGATLKKANLCGSHFRNVNLRTANLSKTNLININLDGSNLSKADLRGAYLRDANLNGAQIEEILLEETELANFDFDQAARRIGDNN